MAAGPFLHQRPHRLPVAQAVARGQRVLLVQSHFVVVAERHRDAALRVLRGRLPQRVLGHHQHAARSGKFDGRAQAGYAGADHEEIRVHWLITSLTRYMVQRLYALLSRGDRAALLSGGGGTRRPGARRRIPARKARQDLRRLHRRRVAAPGRALPGGARRHAATNCCSCPAAKSTSGWRRSKRWPRRWCAAGGDRSSLVIAFGGGIVNDMAGFLAAIFMRGIPVIQVPTTLLAQVDAGIGGKTGVNLVSGKNLIGAFHQPLAVLIDPAVLDTLPEREYRAGLYEIVKAGIIRDAPLFRFLAERRADVLAREAGAVDRIIADCRAHEGRSGLRRRARRRSAPHPQLRPHHRPRAGSRDRLHALPARRGGGVRACAPPRYLAQIDRLPFRRGCAEILDAIEAYGPIPPLDGIAAEDLRGTPGARQEDRARQGALRAAARASAKW